MSALAFEDPKKIPRARKIPELRGPVPSHNELRDMIRDIGLMKNLVVETEYPINEMRLDVAWRLPVRENPDHAWEVHIGGNFFEALAKLKHAWDLWKADPRDQTSHQNHQLAGCCAALQTSDRSHWD